MGRFARLQDLQHNGSAFSSDGLSSSTLRARLSSQGPSSSSAILAAPTSSSSSDAQLHFNDLYQHFRACFATAAADTPKADLRPDGKNNGSCGGDALAQLGESFAQASLKLHLSISEQLSQDQSHITSKIVDFAQTSSSTLSNINKLYANVSFPLSATLCSSASFPCANMAAHLSNMQNQLKQAEEELRDLANEWEDSICLEEGLRKEVASMEEGGVRSVREGNGIDDLKEDIEHMVEDKMQELEDIEMQYKERLQAETMEMMQSILAD